MLPLTPGRREVFTALRGIHLFPFRLLTLAVAIVLGTTLAFAQQAVVCPPGLAEVKVPDTTLLGQDGTFQLFLTCIPAPDPPMLGSTTNEVGVGNLKMIVVPDPDYDQFSTGPLQPIPGALERVVLPDSTIVTQLVCNPSYQGGVPDPVNLASLQPPDPPAGTNANSRARAAASIQQAAMACLLANASSFTSPAFLDQLGVSDQVKQWYAQGYRGDLAGLIRTNVPLIEFVENSSPGFLAVLQADNTLLITFMTGADYQDYASRKPSSIGYDCGCLLGDYAGLVASWLIPCTNAFQNASIQNWPQNSLLALNNGLSLFVAYLHDGTPEVYKYASYAIRRSGNRPCNTTNYPDCFKGNNIRNVMMHDEANLTKDGVYPFLPPNDLWGYDGPVDWDLAGMYFGAVFYDISTELGLGDAKANLLYWKLISVIDVCGTFTMRDFGRNVLLAAAALWPDPANPELSLYDSQLKDLLRSRGIAISGEATFKTNLPAPIGPVRKTTSTVLFGSSIPNVQPTSPSYGVFFYFENSYTQAGAATNDYMVYQFYKYSKYGPCDKLILTDGTYTDTGSGFSYNGNGSYYHELQDRELQNLLLMVPGPTIDWVTYRQRCATEHEGFYAEDVCPFGFRVIKAVKNGFVWKTTRLSAANGFTSYQFDIVDPSQTTVGPATYMWTFTDYTGAQTNLSGASAQYAAQQEQPLDILVSRVRGGETNTIELSEPGSSLDSADRPHYLVGIGTPESSVSSVDRAHYFNLIPAPRFTGYQLLGDGSFDLLLSGPSNATYHMFASTNLVSWQDLGAATQTVAGVYHFVDAAAAARPMRFYRAATP